MKHLTITYDGATLFDGAVTELVWTDSPAGVRVDGKTRPPAGSGGGLIGMLTAASKAKTQQAIEDKRAAYDEQDEDTA